MLLDQAPAMYLMTQHSLQGHLSHQQVSEITSLLNSLYLNESDDKDEEDNSFGEPQGCRVVQD